MIANIVTPHEQIVSFCERHRIRRLLFFGSVLRADFSSDSDIDVLVEFDEEVRITLFDMVDMQDELAALLGRDIDLTTPDGLSKYIRPDVIANAQVIYDRAA